MSPRPHRRRTVVAAALLGVLGGCSPESPERVEHISDHGARGDGTSDDTAAFRRAARAARGGVVDIADGSYAIRRMAIDGHLIRGNGATLRPMGANPRWLSFTGDGAGLEGVNLELGGLVTVAALTFTGARIRVVGVSIRGLPVSAVGVDVRGTSEDVVMERLTVRGGSAAIRVGPGARRIRVTQADLRNWSERGIWVRGDERASVSELLIERSSVAATSLGGSVRQPIQVNGHADSPHRHVRVKDCTVTGRYVDYAAAEGTADLISLHHCHGLEVTGNTCEGGGEVGITVSRGSSGGTVARNTCRRNGSAGIAIGSGAVADTRKIEVLDNTCTDNGVLRPGDLTPDWARAGIVVEGGQDITVRDNRLGNTAPLRDQLYGLTLRRSSGVKLAGNDFRENVRGDVLRS